MLSFDPVNFFSFVGMLIVVLIFFIRIEHRLTRLETLVSVLERRLSGCLPNWDKSTD